MGVDLIDIYVWWKIFMMISNWEKPFGLHGLFEKKSLKIFKM